LLFITRDYDQCLTKIDAFERQFAKEKVFEQIEKIKALCIISNQEKGRAVIRDEAKPIILKYLNDAHFLFSAGRELEYLGNIPDGMALIAYSDKKAKSQNGYSSSLSWEGNRLKNSAYLEYFSSYFDYLDFVYTADELQTVVNKLETKISDDFYPLMYCQLLDDKNSLKDLLGTKYIRENRLHDAERVFSSVNSSYWEKNYNSWGDDQDAVYAQFNQNPFYDIKYTKSFIPHTDKFVVTKLSITQHLIKFLSLANNPKNPDRDYYYFIVGNCYLSMTQYGHSWMMRRFISSSDYDLENETYIDESEYRNSALAKKYYRLAYKHARKDRFKALCLKMEDYAQNNIGSRYVKLKRLYPAYYKELSGCDHLEAYFKSRR